MNPFLQKLITTLAAAALVVVAQVLVKDPTASGLLMALAGGLGGGVLIPRPGDSKPEASAK